MKGPSLNVSNRVRAAMGEQYRSVASFGRSRVKSRVPHIPFPYKTTRRMIAAGTIGGAVAASAFVVGAAKGVMEGMYPRQTYPLAYGKYGFRTAAQAGPAGLEGLKFNFRRRK